MQRDKNTKYYHSKTIIQRNKNKITMLRDKEGRQVNKPKALHKMVTEFYKHLFQQELLNKERVQTTCKFPTLSSNQVVDLSWIITTKETKKAMFAIGSNKAPRPDGYPSLFFQRNRQVVVVTIFKLVLNIFKGKNVAKFNDAFLVLILKYKKPKFVNQFKPIAFCNVVYKCITKIIANSFKPLLPSLISLFQVSFITKRYIQDNIVVIQELIHNMRKMRSKKGFFAIKVNLEKAYDWLNWNFIKEVMHDIQLPN